MLFSSPVFLFIFLPIVLILYFSLKNSLRNYLLLVASLCFYAWGEGFLVLLMIFSIFFNYLFGLLIDYSKTKLSRKWALGVLLFSILANLSGLLYYKYFEFLLENLKMIGAFENFATNAIHLPIGISFYTFQSISYCIDVYREETKVQKNPFSLGLYISLFPQLIAGPIIRYHDVSLQIAKRYIDIEKFKEGIIRFSRGLAKKILLANPLAVIADDAFSILPGELAVTAAWLGIICYALQIYFDFSGYSDMAIGLGKMFGFDFLENFNYPYISKSIQEFWRRWHISLSSWFKDYLYIPLGGNRKGTVRTYSNLLIVFFVTGFWHGASWNFIFWGLFHGIFLIIERLGFNKVLSRTFKPIQYSYTLLVVLVGWVFFRADDFSHGINYLKAMAGISSGANYHPLVHLNHYSMLMLALAVVFSTPLRSKFKEKVDKIVYDTNIKFFQGTYQFISAVLVIILFFFSLMEIATMSYNPFIYFRF